MHHCRFSPTELKLRSTEAASRYGGAFFDEALRLKASTFSEALSAQGTPIDPPSLIELRQIVEEQLIRKIDMLAAIQYTLMEKTGDYTDLGEQRVSLSHCRFMMDVPAEQEVTHWDLERFRNQLNQERKSFRHLSEPELRALEKKEKFEFLGREFDTFQDEAINTHLAWLGSTKRISLGFFDKHRSIIFGDIQEQQLGDYRIYFQNTEDARTPTNCLSIAAIIGEKNVTIRRVALETIFYNKWMRVYETPDSELKRMCRTIEGNIRETLKLKALKAYRVAHGAQLCAIKELFLDEMVEGVFWHEIGHGISMEGIAVEDTALGEAFHVFEDEIVGVLKEFLADAAPPLGELHGPLFHFIDLALNQNQRDKATRMLIVYLSDNWFLDPHETFMAEQTDIIVSLLSSYLGADLSVDFERLQRELPALFQTIQTATLDMIHRVRAHLETAEYEVEGILYPYPEVNAMVMKLMEEDRDEFTPPSDNLQYQTHFWANMFNYAKLYASRTYQSICDDVSALKAKIYTDTADRIALETPSHKSLRQLLFARLKSLGFYRPQAEISVTEAIDMAMEESFVPFSERNKVLKWFREILEGQGMQVSINTLGNPDPAIMVLQELLSRSQAGRIQDGLAMDDPSANENGTPDEKEALIHRQLLKVKDTLDQRAFLRINTLKANSLHTDEPLLRRCLSEIHLSNGEPLLSKIRDLEWHHTNPTTVLELFLPTERGTWCWNTVQAIWRINQKLRPEDKANEWTLDAVVLNFILQEYLCA